MVENQPLNENSSAVQAHIDLTQGVIERMAENSRSCKMWCVTLVAATLVLVARTGEPRHALIALIPTLLFVLLDSYYLALERAFVRSQKAFGTKLHNRELVPTDVYDVAPIGMGWGLVAISMGSVSILPFYVLVSATTLVSWVWVL